MLRAVQYLAGRLGKTVHVRHVARMLDDLTDLADKVSRKDSDFSAKGRRILHGALHRSTSNVPSKWLENLKQPDLRYKLVKELREKYPNR